jgi:hypothetical protein
MRKNRWAFVSSACALAMVANSFAGLSVIAQAKKQERSTNGVLSPALRMVDAVQDPVLPLPPPGGVLFTNGIAVPPVNGVVRDAPFSGEMVIENIQTLADGNKIMNRSSTMIYRDSQGRTRHEYSIKFPGPSGGENKEHQTVQIFDPVSGSNYALDVQNRTAHKFPTLPELNDLATFSKAEVTAKQVKVPGVMVQGAIAGIGAVGHVARSISTEGRNESLGKQMISGVEAEGTRTTHTLPAGTIGNERPIEVIHEHWYSKELQIHVMTKSVDPRWGESTQRLTKINRSEPDASLFQIPSDYTIQETPPMPLMKEEIEMKLREKNRKPNEQ